MNKPEKICKNPNCKKVFSEYASDKRIHCCDTCRWQKNFNLNKIKNKKRNLHFNEIKRSEKIIDFLASDGFLEIEIKTLEKINFNFDALYNKNSNSNTTNFEIGKYFVTQNSSNPESFIFNTQQHDRPKTIIRRR